MYDEILVPTDGSAATQKAVDHALGLAAQYDARVHALYVVDTSMYTTLEAGSDVVLSALEKEGSSAVEKVVAAGEKAGVDVTTNVVTGTAYRTILDYADEEDIDLIVMGTHGRTGINRYLLGSVTERVVRSSDVPVLTVRMGEEDAEDTEAEE